MKTISLLALAVLAVLFAALPVFSIDRGGQRYAKPPAVPSISSWPEGLAAIIADKTYLDGYNYQNPGYIIENIDTFFYGGDTEALNLFLEKLAKVKGLHLTVAFSRSEGRVNRYARAGTVKIQEELGHHWTEIDGESCSWLMSVTPKDWIRDARGGKTQSESQVIIFLGSKKINAEKLSLPAWGD